MAYWWVAQNHTFKEERGGGLLWAPKLDKAHKTPHHWATLAEVQPGDVIFSFVNKRIPAISIALTKAYEHSRPPAFQTAAARAWQHDGFRIDVDYRAALGRKLLGPGVFAPKTTTMRRTNRHLFWPFRRL